MNHQKYDCLWKWAICDGWMQGDAGAHLKFVTNLVRSALLDIFFEDFKFSVFDSYVRGPGCNTRVLVAFFSPLRI